MIYEHSDCRSWLRSELQARVNENPAYSGSAFAKSLGFSQSYFSLLLAGKRRTTIKIGARIAEKLQLDSRETEYLYLLIKRENTRDASLRIFLNNEIRKFCENHRVQQLDLEHFKFISDWYCSALLELLTIIGESHAHDHLAARLGITATDLDDAIRRLETLNMIKKIGDRYHRTDAGYLATASNIVSQGLRNFHKQILKMAAVAIENQDVMDRHISGITMAIDPAKLPEAKKRIEEFKKELSDFLESGAKKRVYQLSLQLFRLDIEQNANEGDLQC